MKRQKGTPKVVAATTDKVTKKKDKGAAEKTAKEAAEKVAEESAEWASLWSGVDEQMELVWATSWIPFWEVDAYDVLYGDVLWDYDIWDLKSIRNPPNP
ncbi:hypothetical protein ACS0TY_008336 [Phlomoides rotata]